MKRQRLLMVSADLLVDILKGLQDGKPRAFEVVSEPLPDDTKIVSVRSSLYWPNTVEIVLESASFTPAEERTRISPVLRTVEP